MCLRYSTNRDEARAVFNIRDLNIGTTQPVNGSSIMGSFFVTQLFKSSSNLGTYFAALNSVCKLSLVGTNFYNPLCTVTHLQVDNSALRSYMSILRCLSCGHDSDTTPNNRFSSKSVT